MNLTYGSQGSEVKKLQNALNQAGYSLNVDGIYGRETEAAVRDYQSKNGLAVDGIAGNKTQTSLYGAAAPSDPQNPPADTADTAEPETPSYTYDAAGDAAYQAALRELEAAQTAAEPDWDESYDRELRDLYDRILNRTPFSYDLSSDLLYQQYRQQYTSQGRLAMMDTMGQAAALTGGYASSYAQAVGQQQYDTYLQSLNDLVPDLYQMALSQYNAEGESLADQYAMLRDLRDDAYQQYRDELDAYHQNLASLQERADLLYDRGYQSWKTETQLRNEAEQRDYDRQQDAYDKQQDTYDRVVKIITTLGYIPSNLLAEAGMSQAEAQKWLNYYYAQQTPTGSSSGGSSSRKSGSSGRKSGSSGSKTTSGYKTLTGLLSGNLSTTKRRNLITSYYQAGKITKSQYNALLRQYCSGSSSGSSGTSGGRNRNTEAAK